MEINRVRLHILQLRSHDQSRRWVSLGARRRVPTMTSDIWGMVSTKVSQRLLTLGTFKGSTPVTEAIAPPTADAI